MYEYLIAGIIFELNCFLPFSASTFMVEANLETDR